MNASWDRRLRRAEALSAGSGPTSPLLNFYAQVLRCQAAAYDAFQHRTPIGSLEDDADLIGAGWPLLLRTVADHGSPTLAEEARKLLASGDSDRRDLLIGYWHDRSDRSFFAKALLQPYGQWLADAGVAQATREGSVADNRCPRCGGAPQLSILDAAAMAGAGGSRHLLCATCLTPWPFRRVLCPACGEEDERKLGYFRSTELAHVRVDACESCRRYLKAIDMSRLGVAVPLIDEVAAAPLDVWAREQGYDKIELNLVGL